MIGDDVKINFGSEEQYKKLEAEEKKLEEYTESSMNGWKFVMDGTQTEKFLKNMKCLDEYLDWHYGVLDAYYEYNPEFKSNSKFKKITKEDWVKLNIGIFKFYVLIELFKRRYVPLDFVGQDLHKFVHEYISDLFDPGWCFFNHKKTIDEIYFGTSTTLILPTENQEVLKSRYFDIQKSIERRFIFEGDDGEKLETPIEETIRTAYIMFDNIYDVHLSDTHSYVKIRTNTIVNYPEQD